MSDLVERLRASGGTHNEHPQVLLREAADEIERLRVALEPFVKLFEANRERHMKRSAEAVKLGRVWFDEMPDDWIFATQGLTMGDFRRARTALSGAAKVREE